MLAKGLTTVRIRRVSQDRKHGTRRRENRHRNPMAAPSDHKLARGRRNADEKHTPTEDLPDWAHHLATAPVPFFHPCRGSARMTATLAYTDAWHPDKWYRFGQFPPLCPST